MSFPGVLRNTAANRERIKELLPKGMMYGEPGWTEDPDFLASLPSRPLLRATYMWRVGYFRSGLSPFGLAGLAGVSVQRTLNQLSKEGWLKKLYWCGDTKLPICHWATDSRRLGIFLPNPPTAVHLVRSFEPEDDYNYWTGTRRPGLSFSQIKEIYEGRWEKEPRKFRVPGMRGVVLVKRWKELQNLVLMQEGKE